jgi:hypothetical protein
MVCGLLLLLYRWDILVVSRRDSRSALMLVAMMIDAVKGKSLGMIVVLQQNHSCQTPQRINVPSHHHKYVFLGR